MIEDFLVEQKRQRNDFDVRLADIDEKIKEAESAEENSRRDPEVLVRMSLGARRRVYHDASDPCGRTKHNGGKQGAFRKMPESEAKLMDGGILTRCTSCWKP
jgi:hypothetical protein